MTTYEHAELMLDKLNPDEQMALYMELFNILQLKFVTKCDACNVSNDFRVQWCLRCGARLYPTKREE